MRYLVYRSTALVEPGSPGCAGILASARRNNARLGLTGILHIQRDMFVQYLEGEPAALHSVFDTISMDPRHRDVTVLGSGDVEARRFDGWHMAYSTAAVLSLDDFLDEIGHREKLARADCAEAIYFLMAAGQRIGLGLSDGA